MPVYTITNDVNHNAFPCMIYFNGALRVIYRTGVAHDSYDGVLNMKTSTDNGTTWSTATTIVSEAGKDYRDPSMIVFNNTLVLRTFYRVDGGEIKTCIFTSTDGVTFSNKILLPSPSSIDNGARGSMTVFNNILYSMNYVASGTNNLFLVSTTDLVNFTIVNSMVQANGNEASISFTGTKMLCIYRQVKNDATGKDWDVGCGYIESFDNGVTWTNFKELPFGNHCPTIFKTLDGGSDTFLVLFRNTRYQADDNRTHVSLVRVDGNGHLLSRDYSCFWAAGVWDVAYGDIVEYNGSTYIVYYYWSGGGHVMVKKFAINDLRQLSQYNKPASTTAPTSIQATHYTNNASPATKTFKIVTGWITVTGDGTASKQFTINFTGTPYSFSYVPTDANGLYKVNHVSAAAGSVTAVLSRDNGATFTTSSNVYYVIYVV